MSWDVVVRIAWLLLAALHGPPAAVAARPSLVQRLYGEDTSGTTGTLLVHRGMLFLALFVVALWAAFDPAVRRMSAVAMAISMVGFLLLVLRTGTWTGTLRSIALADLVGMIPLALVCWDALRR